MEFKLGDVVVLKSGGPPMTIDGIGGDIVSCVWYDGSGVRREDFGPNSLKKHSDSSRGGF